MMTSRRFGTLTVYSSTHGRPQAPYSSRDASAKFYHCYNTPDPEAGYVGAEYVQGCCRFNWYCPTCAQGQAESPHLDCPGWSEVRDYTGDYSDD